MTEELTSEGKCVYCNEVFTQNAIVKHLATHFKKQEKENRAEHENVYHLNVEADEMFLQVLVKGGASFKTLDTFLRKIWVECCGHLSDFHHKKFEIRMSDKFDMVLTPKLKFDYSYDYGSTTSFSIQVCGSYQIAQKENVLLLSRNEPLKILCRVCNKNRAVAICTIHMYEADEYIFCEECASAHEDECSDFQDYARMPVVNSPRMGTCGYEGGSIDKHRDGTYTGAV